MTPGRRAKKGLYKHFLCTASPGSREVRTPEIENSAEKRIYIGAQPQARAIRFRKSKQQDFTIPLWPSRVGFECDGYARQIWRMILSYKLAGAGDVCTEEVRMRSKEKLSVFCKSILGRRSNGKNMREREMRSERDVKTAPL